MKIGFFNTVRENIELFIASCERYDNKIEIVDLALPALDESASKVYGCDAVIFTPYKGVTEKFYLDLKNNGVKYILACIAGTDHLDLNLMKKLGLKSANAPKYSPNAISEHAILSLLAILRNYREQLHRVDNANYLIDGVQGREIRNQTIGIVGAGRIGYTTMKCLSGFGPKAILAHDKFENEQVAELAKYVSLDELYEKCDVIIYHCNYTEQNHHMVNEQTLAKMKDGVILVNVARGGIFDTKAVLKAVESGKIGGLAIDVLEEENMVRNSGNLGVCPVEELTELLKHKNVIYTTHTAFYTDQALKDMADITIDNAYEYLTTGECRYELVK